MANSKKALKNSFVLFLNIYMNSKLNFYKSRYFIFPDKDSLDIACVAIQNSLYLLKYNDEFGLFDFVLDSICVPNNNVCCIEKGPLANFFRKINKTDSLFKCSIHSIERKFYSSNEHFKRFYNDTFLHDFYNIFED